MTYHLAKIPRGVFGEVSKIYEEVAELNDATGQGAKIMALCECADIIGAVEGYLEKHHPGVTLADVLQMKDLTKRAFQSGARQDKEPAKLPATGLWEPTASGGWLLNPAPDEQQYGLDDLHLDIMP